MLLLPKIAIKNLQGLDETLGLNLQPRIQILNVI